MRGVYLLHLDRPLSPKHTTRHYKGSAEDIATRIEEHRRGNGARMMRVAAERGIGFELARVWEVPNGSLRQAEKIIKQQKNGRACARFAMSERRRTRLQ